METKTLVDFNSNLDHLTIKTNSIFSTTQQIPLSEMFILAYLFALNPSVQEIYCILLCSNHLNQWFHQSQIFPVLFFLLILLLGTSKYDLSIWTDAAQTKLMSPRKTALSDSGWDHQRQSTAKFRPFCSIEINQSIYFIMDFVVWRGTIFTRVWVFFEDENQKFTKFFGFWILTWLENSLNLLETCVQIFWAPKITSRASIGKKQKSANFSLRFFFFFVGISRNMQLLIYWFFLSSFFLFFFKKLKIFKYPDTTTFSPTS